MSWSLKNSSFTEKNLNFVIFVNRKYLKAISSENFGNHFSSSFWMYIRALVISFLLHNNLIHKVWFDLTNERQPKTPGFLDKISEPHGINLSQGQWVLPGKYNYLIESDWITWFVLLCCLVYLFGLCIKVPILELSLSFTVKRLCKSFCW